MRNVSLLFSIIFLFSTPAFAQSKLAYVDMQRAILASLDFDNNDLHGLRLTYDQLQALQTDVAEGRSLESEQERQRELERQREVDERREMERVRREREAEAVRK